MDRSKFSKKFSVKLKKARKKAGLTQAALAKKAGCTRVHIAYLEAGKYCPGIVILRKLVKILKFKVDFV